MHVLNRIYSTKMYSLYYKNYLTGPLRLPLTLLATLAFHSSVVVRVNLNLSQFCWTGQF